MNQLQTQNRAYWVSDFAITESDIEQIYNHFLEVEQPQVVDQIAQVIVAHRVAEERNRIKQRMTGRAIYQPRNSYQVGDELVFPALKYAQGDVTAIREGYDPQYGTYDVIAVKMGTRTREFASALAGEHVLNRDNGETYDPMVGVDVDELTELYGPTIAPIIAGALVKREEFVEVGGLWFVRGLMADVNIGHLHLAEAVLEMSQGGPLPVAEIAVHLDMDQGLNPEVRTFSLNHALIEDERFDEVGQPGKVAWFLRRMEPDAVRVVPERLRLRSYSYNRAILTPQLLLLERELDDEWSELELMTTPQPTILSVTYPHRRAGTLPLSSRTSALFPTGISARQQVVLVDEMDNTEIPAWIVQDERYIFGLREWYREHTIPVGGFITLKPGPEPGIVMIGYDKRRPKKEWVRLASVADGRLEFELDRRSVNCGYDDLLIVGTDYVAAVDAFARRIEANNWSLETLLINIFPSLAKLNPQGTVHSKTLYSAVNMIWRVPPGPLFAELLELPAFLPVGDHYWSFDRARTR